MKLLRLSRDVMVLSLFVMLAGLFVGFALEGHAPLPVQVIGHALAMLSAISLKLGYILRLEALAIIERERESTSLSTPDANTGNSL